MLHLAREKLGELATNEQVNAEVARRRGLRYSMRHVRQLNAERRQLITQWRESQEITQQEEVKPATDPGDFHTPDMQYIVQDSIAHRGGEFGSQCAPEAEVKVAPVLKSTVKRRSKPQNPIEKRIEAKTRRRQRWQAMNITQLEREYFVLLATARKTKNPKQQRALEYQVEQLGHELASKRREGLARMLETNPDATVSGVWQRFET